MRNVMMKVVMLAVLCLLCVHLLALGGCSQSRQAKLERKGEAVRASLIKERNRVLAMPAGTADRAGRLAHLEGLHNTLSAANVGLGTVPLLLQGSQQDVAFDVIEEVYATIEWNTPLAPGDAMRPMPAAFANNTLNLSPGSGVRGPTLHSPPLVAPK